MCPPRREGDVYRVLVAVSDDVDQARKQAEFVASLPGRDALDVTVTHAYDETNERGPHGESLPPEESDGVQAAKALLEDAGVPVETRETYHPVAEGVVDLATDVDADLVVVGARKRTPIGKAVFGSVTQSVVLDSPVPVTVVGVE
jgi:nucleotide-binding universal stress UspA family protein